MMLAVLKRIADATEVSDEALGVAVLLGAAELGVRLLQEHLGHFGPRHQRRVPLAHLLVDRAQPDALVEVAQRLRLLP